MKKKVIIIDDVHPILKQKLEENQFECEIFEGKSYSEIASKISAYEGLVVRSGIPIDRNLLEKATKLKFVARIGAGLENIDLEYAKFKGIECLNSPEGNRDAVGEHSIGMLLNLFNKINQADQEVRHHIWQRERNRGIELSGKTVGIIGFGNMGSAFAQRLQGFDVTILAYDKYKSNYSTANIIESSMNDVFLKSDVVSLHIPLTEETENLVDEKWIHSFAKPIYLINTARGPIVKTKDLVEAMQIGKVLGACLDVLEFEGKTFEKLTDNENIWLDYLKKSKQTVLTPHIAGWTIESNFKLANIMADKILNLYC